MYGAIIILAYIKSTPSQYLLVHLNQDIQNNIPYTRLAYQQCQAPCASWKLWGGLGYSCVPLYIIIEDSGLTFNLPKKIRDLDHTQNFLFFRHIWPLTDMVNIGPWLFCMFKLYSLKSLLSVTLNENLLHYFTFFDLINMYIYSFQAFMRLVSWWWWHMTHMIMVEVELWAWTLALAWLLCTLSHTQQAAGLASLLTISPGPATRHSLLSLHSLSARSQSTDCREREQSPEWDTSWGEVSRGPGQRERQPPVSWAR